MYNVRNCVFGVTNASYTYKWMRSYISRVPGN